MASNLTKLEKIELVSKVLEVIESGEYVFMCNAIEVFSKNTSSALKILPEIVKYRPSTVNPKYTWACWSHNNEEGKQERIKILKALLEELNGEN